MTEDIQPLTQQDMKETVVTFGIWSKFDRYFTHFLGI